MLSVGDFARESRHAQQVVSYVPLKEHIEDLECLQMAVEGEMYGLLSS